MKLKKKGKLDGYVVTVDVGSWSFFVVVVESMPEKDGYGSDFMNWI